MKKIKWSKGHRLLFWEGLTFLIIGILLWISSIYIIISNLPIILISLIPPFWFFGTILILMGYEGIDYGWMMRIVN